MAESKLNYPGFWWVDRLVVMAVDTSDWPDNLFIQAYHLGDKSS